MVDMVDGYSDSFNEHAERLREERGQDDFDNLQHSLSGLETGQQTRHGLSKDTSSSIFGDKRKSITEQIRETLEWLLLNNPQYKLAHESFMNSVHEAQHITQTALERVIAQLANERIVLDELLDSAAKLPDGTKVFKDKNGVVKNQDGEDVSAELAATIQWTGNEPSYEAYQAQTQRIEQLEARENELRGIETELGEIHERGNTNSVPMSEEDLNSETKRANALKERVNEIELETFSKLPLQNKLHSDVETLETVSRETTAVPIVKIGK
jgi:hypothetical protein